MKLQERRVNDLVDESCLASARGEFQLVCLSVCLSVSPCFSVRVCIIITMGHSTSLLVGIVRPL